MQSSMAAGDGARLSPAAAMSGHDAWPGRFRRVSALDSRSGWGQPRSVNCQL